MSIRTHKSMLKVAVLCFVLCVTAMGVMAQVAMDPNTTAGRALSKGSAQTVLAVVTLGLSVAVIYLAKKLQKSQDLRVDEAKEHANSVQILFETKLEENSKAQENATLTNKSVASALHRNSDVLDKILTH